MALSGCLRINADLVLNSDNTVSGSYTYAVSTSRAEALEVSAEDLADQLGAGDAIETFSHATSTPYIDDGLDGVRIDFTDEPLATFDGVTLTDRITITREGAEYVLDAPTLGDLTDEDAATLADAEITLTVTFPGEVTEHNGTLDGHTVSWNLTTVTEPPHARGYASADGFPWVIAGVSGAVIAGALGTLWWRTRRDSAALVPTPPGRRGGRRTH
jgi:hypothetical protein